MKLTSFIKYFWLFIFSFSGSICAQDIQTDKKVADTTKTYQEYTSINISYLFPNPVGDNFASEALDFKYGYNLDLKYYFPFHLMVGYKYQFMRANPSQINLIGNYDRTNINTHGLMLGYYIKTLDRFYIEPVFTIGLTNYNNKKDYPGAYLDRIKFTDDAFSLIFSTTISYELNDKISLFFQPDYRIDFTSIETAAPIQDFFDRAEYFNLQIGLRFGFD